LVASLGQSTIRVAGGRVAVVTLPHTRAITCRASEQREGGLP
jgi:hypothetical protein